MKSKKTRIAFLSAGVLAAILFLFLSYARVFDEFEYSTLDFRFKLRPQQPVDEDIVIIHIGDDTIEKLGEWPLPRKYHGLLIKALEAAGVKTIIFDVFFSEETEDDQGFVDAVKASDNVYLAYVFELNPPVRGKKYITASRVIAPLINVLKSACKGRRGFVNVVPDRDGKVRRILPFVEYKGKFHPQITIQAVLNNLDFLFDKVEIIPAKKIVMNKDLRIPLEDFSSLLVNYPGPWGKAFRHYSYVDVLQSHLSSLMGQEPVIDLNELKDTVCFVGFTATASPDAHPSPLAVLYPGVGVHASVYNSVVQQKFLCRVNRWWNLLILVVLWLITGFITARSRKLLAFLSIVLIFLAYIAIAVAVFIFCGLWIDIFYPMVTVVGIYGIFTCKKYLVETEKRELIEKELDIAKNIQESFLPKEIPQVGGLDLNARMLTARQVGGDLYDIVQLDETRMGVMLGDVSGKGVPAALFMAQVVSVFTSFVQEASPADVLRKVNDRLVSEGSSNLFVTLTYIVLDTRKNTCSFASGGHLPTLLIEPDGNVKLLDVEEGMPLGLIEGDFSEGELEYKPGSIFVLYTDGVTEAMNMRHELFEEERLVELAKTLKGRSAKEVVDAIHKSVADYAGKAEQHDDITVLAVRT